MVSRVSNVQYLPLYCGALGSAVKVLDNCFSGQLQRSICEAQNTPNKLKTNSETNRKKTFILKSLKVKGQKGILKQQEKSDKLHTREPL